MSQSTLPIPRYWINVGGGYDVEVRIEGDSIYEISEQEWKKMDYTTKAKMVCEAKRQGDKWTGVCHFRFDTVGAMPEFCTIEAEEVITSVTPTRIQGVSQALLPAKSLGTCPTVGESRNPFTLIPKN